MDERTVNLTTLRDALDVVWFLFARDFEFELSGSDPGGLSLRVVDGPELVTGDRIRVDAGYVYVLEEDE